MYLFLTLVSYCFRLAPHFLVDGLAKFLAFFMFDVVKLRQKLILKNTKIAFPEMDLQAHKNIGRNSIYNFLLTIFEFFRSRSVDIAGDIEVDPAGEKILKGALTKGQGAYVLCCHLGSWEAMGAKYSRAFAPTHVIVKKIGAPPVDRFVNELRDHNGFLSVKRKQKGDAHRAIKKALSQNEIIGFVMDQARSNEPRLPFFSEDASTNTSFAAIWRKNPAPIFPSWLERKKMGKHVLHIHPEVVPIVTEDDKADILAHSAMFNKEVEKMIVRKPNLYFWLHNRWK